MMNINTTPSSPMRRRLMLALGALPLMPLAAHAAGRDGELPMLEAVNMAGRQRSFPQRVAKFYAQQLCGVRADEAADLKMKAIALFEQQNRMLTEFATRKNAKDILDTYAKLDSAWADFKVVATGTVTQAGLKQVSAMSEQLLTLAQQGTVQFATLAATQTGQLVALAGRNRMLSQRISKYYFMQASGLDTPQTTAEIQTERNEFITNMQTLKNAAANTKSTRNALGLAETQWLFFDAGLQGAKNSQDLANQRNNVAVASENIFQVMDQLVATYASIS